MGHILWSDFLDFIPSSNKREGHGSLGCFQLRALSPSLKVEGQFCCQCSCHSGSWQSRLGKMQCAWGVPLLKSNAVGPLKSSLFFWNNVHPVACSLRPGEWGYSQLAFASISLTNEISWLVGGYCDMERQVALDICHRILSSVTIWEPKTPRIWVNFSVLVRLIWPNMIISVSLLLSNWSWGKAWHFWEIDMTDSDIIVKNFWQIPCSL